MPWQQLKIQLASNKVENLEQQLLELGALSFTYQDAKDQPVFQKEPGSTPLWENTFLLCLFESSTPLGETVAWLREHPDVADNSDIELNLLEDEDWERCWMDNFQAMQFGKKLWICPSWQTPPDPNAVNIMLDPGLAFGSGTHATTALCLRWLEQLDLRDKVVIDYGCGSGVLALAAALLGASTVYAIDNDPQAIQATRDNQLRNHLPATVIQPLLPEQLPELEADLLVANILAEPLQQLASTFHKLLKPGGAIALSGILQEQVDELMPSYGKYFDMDPPVLDQEWVRLTGIKAS